MKKTEKIQLASTDQCTGCSACASICPTNSITMREDREGFLQPHIDTDTCIKCHKCEKTCPIISPITIPTDFETQAFAAINKDEAVRMRSSSGGIFHALAKWTIEQGGVVFGARFDDKWDVVHDYTETIEGIEPFMRSKYVQSRIGDSFKQAKQFLNLGRQVLFVGTPCQIGGLKSFLHKGYDNLLVVDLICHGVPSPWSWREYLKSFSVNRITSINFKDKSIGWLPHQCQVTITTNNAIVQAKQMDNPFFRCYRNGIIMRNSCYHCHFRDLHRISDITISDFWGVEEKCPDMFDNKGTSLILVQTSNVLEKLHILGNVSLKKQNILELAVRDKSPNANPIPTPIKRCIFFRTLMFSSFGQSMGIIDSIEKWQRRYIKYKGKLISKILRK